MKKILIGILGGLLLTTPAYAEQVEASLSLSAQVGAACSVMTSPVVFQDYDGTLAVQGSGAIAVWCLAGMPFNISLDAGQNFNLGAYGDRTLTNGEGVYLDYVLVKPNTNNPWGDADFANTYPFSSLADIGSGSQASYPVDATLLPSTGSVAPGLYTDTVNVTVHF
jgi:spore coat protein U-like protein